MEINGASSLERLKMRTFSGPFFAGMKVLCRFNIEIIFNRSITQIRKRARKHLCKTSHHAVLFAPQDERLSGMDHSCEAGFGVADGIKCVIRPLCLPCPHRQGLHHP